MKVDGHLNLMCLRCSCLITNTNSNSAVLWFSCFLFFLESWIERCLNESENKRYSSHTSLGNVSNDESKSLKLILPWHPRHGQLPRGRNDTSRVLGRGQHSQAPGAFGEYVRPALWYSVCVCVCGGYNAVRWTRRPRPRHARAGYTCMLSDSPKNLVRGCSSGHTWTLDGKGPSLCHYRCGFKVMCHGIVVLESQRSLLLESKNFS